MSDSTRQNVLAFEHLIYGFGYFLLFITSIIVANGILNMNCFRKLKKIEDASNALLFLYGGILVLTLIILFAIRKKNFFEETHFQKFSIKFLPAIMIITLGAYVFTDAIVNLLPRSLLKSYEESSSFISEGSFVGSMIAQVIIAPLTEELIFRGLMLSRFNKALPSWMGITISSLLFGIMHGNLVWFVYAAVLGALFCIVAELTGSIFSTFLMHSLINACGTLSAYLLPVLAPEELYGFLVAGILLTILGTFLFARTLKSMHSDSKATRKFN